MEDKLLLTEKEAAHLLSMSWHFLRRDRIKSNSEGIPFIRVGAAVRYRRADLEGWIERQANKPVGQEIAAPDLTTEFGPRRRGRPSKAEQVVRRARISTP